MIRNRDALATSHAREVALDCVTAGIEAARPDRVVAETVTRDGDTLGVAPPGVSGSAGASPVTVDLAEPAEVVVLGGGKAAAGVAAALEPVLGDALDGGLVVTDTPVETDRVAVREGDHPVPTERNVVATRDLLERAGACTGDTLVIAPLTGGASALLAAPAAGLTLADLRDTTAALLESGADIGEINAVRKHCSAIKGGRLARAVAPARLVTLALSDVVGDDLSVIGSGPTVPDPSTYGDAVGVLEDFAVGVPDAVRSHLERGATGDAPETPKPGDPAFERASARVVASNATALAAARRAVPSEYDVAVLSSRFEGEARHLAGPHVAVAAEAVATGNPLSPPAVFLSGGEATVAVTGDGEGGPNQEFGLAAAIELAYGAVPGVGGDDATARPDHGDAVGGARAGAEEVVVAAVDTDGRDGATDAAGALVDRETLAPDGGTTGDRSAARAALAANDVTPFLADRGALVETGRTGTNVNDLRVVVVR
ncbi:MAG: glycerate kinase [Halobacteriaceae archaeon]